MRINLKGHGIKAKGKNGYFVVNSALVDRMTHHLGPRSDTIRIEVYSKRVSDKAPLVLEGPYPALRSFLRELSQGVAKV